MVSLKQLKFYLQIICAVGIILSSYALFVETKVENDKNYKAYCDINENISCTKAFSSKYGKGFGLIQQIFGEESLLNQPNSIYGIFFYMVMGGMGLSDDKHVVKVQTVLSLLSNFMSIYLGHILYFELEDMCLVCVATYLINAIIFALCYMKRSIVVGSKCSLINSRSDKTQKNKGE